MNEQGIANKKPFRPKCVKCNRTLVLRTRKSDQVKFWGCPNYPTCKYTKSYNKDDEKDSFTPNIRLAYKILRNRDSYTETEIEGANKVIEKNNAYRSCPKCKNVIITQYQYDLGGCPVCTQWLNLT